MSEEELRGQFESCGTIENIRLVRDPKTHLGKGIGYIMFSTKEEMIDCMTAKKSMRFKGRELRINRATEPKRREKKDKRQAAAQESRKELRQAKKDILAEDDQLKNMGDIDSGEDSEDDKGKQRKAERQVRLDNTSFENSSFG